MRDVARTSRALVRMLGADVLGDGDALAVVVEADEHQACAADHILLLAVDVEFPGFDRDGDALAADAVDLAVDLDQVVLLHRRLEQDLLHLEGDHRGAVAHLIDKRHRRFVDPAEHGAAKQVVVHPEVVLLAHFGS